MDVAVIQNPIQFQFHHLLVSMDEKRRIKFQGEIVEATLMSPPVLTEEMWNRYLLSDGSIVRAKLVATDIDRVEGKYNAEGNPMYNVSYRVIIWVTSPEHLRQKGGDDTHGD